MNDFYDSLCSPILPLTLLEDEENEIPSRKPIGDGDDQRWIETPELLLSDSEDSTSAADDLFWWFPTSRKPPAAMAPSPLSPASLDLHPDDHHVRFNTAHIREHAITVGDHPACHDSLPLTLDWQHADEKVYDIDWYESFRRQRRKGRRGSVPRLDFRKRRELLERVGPTQPINEGCCPRIEIGLEEDGLAGTEFVLDDLQQPEFHDDCGCSDYSSCSNAYCSEHDNTSGFTFPAMKVQVIED